MCASPSSLHSGIDRLLADDALVARLGRGRVALLSNRACLTRAAEPSARALARVLGSGERGLVRLFAPEHGFEIIAAEGAGIADGVEPGLGLPVHSLYGPRRAPTPETLAGLDVLIVDLQDVGVRCYTYATTAALTLAALAGSGIEVIVCDRPNPLGRSRAGPALDPQLRSFVGYLDVPFRHGQTLGAMLTDFAAHRLPGSLAMTVMAAGAQAFAPPMPWVPPSPSLANWGAVRLYPGLVFLEGCNVSEGRGTDAPFRCIAAPGLDGDGLAAFVNGLAKGGVQAHSTSTVPASGKLKGETCTGVRLDVTDFGLVDGLTLGVRVLCWLAGNYPDFTWTRATVPAADATDPLVFSARSGYFIDYLLGDGSLRRGIDGGDGADEILARWHA